MARATSADLYQGREFIFPVGPVGPTGPQCQEGYRRAPSGC